MQTIGLTDFWIDRPYISNSNNFSILSDKWCSLNNCTIGNGKAYYYNGLVDKQQLKCIVIDDTFYLDFSANYIADQIKQQMWILSHTKGIEYKLELVSLWEMFKLPTIEQLNEFAKIKQEVVVPTLTSHSEYDNAVEEMRLSTGLSERDQVRNTDRSLSDYIDLMQSMYHTRLTEAGVIRYATIIHNYHHPVVEEVAEVTSELPSSSYTEALRTLRDNSNLTIDDLQPRLDEEPLVITTINQEEYDEALNELLEYLDIEPSDILPLSTSSLEEYLEYLSDNVLVDGVGESFISIDTIDYYGTIVYNYHNGTQE